MKRKPPESFEPLCSVYIDACTGRLWMPLAEGGFKLLGKADPRAVYALLEPILQPLLSAYPTPVGARSNASELLTFAAAAQRCGIARKTLYEWKRTGKLRREHGLVMLGRSPHLEWGTFKASIDKGELS